MEKTPFQLPEFIEATGIQRIRAAYQEKEDKKRLKQKARAATQPKMGAIDIDYQVLHDAFFRFQTKPKLSLHGDVYYEGKENEISLKEKRPGDLSEELKVIQLFVGVIYTFRKLLVCQMVLRHHG